MADIDDGDDVPARTATPAGSEGSDSSDPAGEDTFGGAGAASPYEDEKVEQDLETAEERVFEEPDDAVWAEQDTAAGGGPAEHPQRYDGPEVYVGVEPPEGFTIKGNERSMKYHVPDSNSYGRTIAQVWFSSEEAAQAAGFTRAQH